jgi:demethylmenaquinone methyltransferase/2-methoxy-6-polyprenyl-1,4-benzoquinol methylase
MLTNSKEITVQLFFQGTGATSERIVNRFTFGFDDRWKDRIIDKIPPHASYIIDQACGTGILTFKIADRFPLSRITGVELREEYLNFAHIKILHSHRQNIDFLLGRAEDIVLPAPVDCITSSYLAKYADLPVLIRNAFSMLTSGGRLIMHDFTYPEGRIFPFVWKFYFKLMQAAGSRIYPEWRTVFFELPDFLMQTRWVAESQSLLEKIGFSRIETEY